MGKVIIVTGGAQGIGAAIVRRLASGGWAVVIADIQGKRAQSLAEELRGMGKEVMAIETDVSDEGQVRAMCAETKRLFGGIDALINNAGILWRGDLTECPAEVFDRLVAVNLRGAFLCIKHVAPLMKERGGGVIVNIASIHAFATLSGVSVYAATKTGLIGLTKGAALDLGKWNIRVVAVCPGAVDTPLLRRDRTEREVAQVFRCWRDASPLRMILRPEDVAHFVFWLLSDEARGLTGIAVPLDAGVTADLGIYRGRGEKERE